MEPVTVVSREPAARPAADGRRRERVFYTGTASASAVIVFAGFARTYYLRPYFDARPLLPLLHLREAGLNFRRRADAHKRLVLLATVAILPAAVARLPFDFIQGGGPPAFFGPPDLFVAVCPIYDLVTRRRPHPATVWGGRLLVAPPRLLVGHTQARLAFAAWLTRWVD